MSAVAGKRAYEKGLYQDSVRYFEKALNEEGWMSRLGGDIQLWLALAYQVRSAVAAALPHARPVQRQLALTVGVLRLAGSWT
jgi:hypothetical protein